MSRDVLAYRSQEHPGEPAVAARADHEQIGVLGEVDEQFRRVALLDLRMHEDRRILAEDGRPGSFPSTAPSPFPSHRLPRAWVACRGPRGSRRRPNGGLPGRRPALAPVLSELADG